MQALRRKTGGPVPMQALRRKTGGLWPGRCDAGTPPEPVGDMLGAGGFCYRMPIRPTGNHS
jgi:hypothetical protein